MGRRRGRWRGAIRWRAGWRFTQVGKGVMRAGRIMARQGRSDWGPWYCRTLKLDTGGALRTLSRWVESRAGLGRCRWGKEVLIHGRSLEPHHNFVCMSEFFHRWWLDRAVYSRTIMRPSWWLTIHHCTHVRRLWRGERSKHAGRLNRLWIVGPNLVRQG